MFCVKCGNKIVDGSSFCPKCGTKVNASEVVTTSNQGSLSKELDRRALKIYMRNVLMLECIVHKISEQINALNEKIKDVESNNYYRQFDTGNSNGKYRFFYDGKNYLVKVLKWGGCVDANHFGYDGTLWANIEDVLPRLNEDNRWYSGIYLANNKPSRMSGLSEKVKFNKEKNAKKKVFLQYWNEFKETAPTEYEKNKKTISNLEAQHEALCTKYKEAKRILNKVYQVNIVPGMFRNKLYAIYYLYDLVATSNMSFEMAILNCNLDEIKTKLDKVIAKQQESIINQATMIAQNRELCEKTERALKELAAIETNTSQAAQYAEIAATNSETIAWFSRYNVR